MPKTGATRYQKFLKSEKSKTKFKAKNKELPKGTNVTKTNFKVKKIIIKEQLRKHLRNEALSTRKLNIKDLLSRLNHLNMRTQTDSLDGLKELIGTHPEVLEQSLGQLIRGVTPLTLNIERMVRRESIKVLHQILSSTALEKIEPFFDILSTYLRSAMTHIDVRIQEDSLLFLDVLLLCTSESVAQDFHRIIPNFLDMISKLDSKPGRTLTVNLGREMTTVKWRVKVLHRLRDFLQKYIEFNKINNSNQPDIDNVHVFDNTKCNAYPLFNTNYTTVCYASCFSSKNSHETTSLNEVEMIKGYVEILMPLLFETWLEVSPNMNTDPNIETLVSEDAAGLLKHILEIISLLWDLVQYLNKINPSTQIEKTFRMNYKDLFNQRIVASFPYVANLRSKKKTCDIPFEDAITDSKLVAENLKICHMFINFNPYMKVEKNKNEINAVLNYIGKTFNKNSQDDINDVIINILHTIFSDEITNWTKSLSTMDALFRKVIESYLNKNLSNSFRQKIFTLLCKIALNDKLGHFHSSDAYEKWLTNLPDILLEDSITLQTINVIHKFAVHGNKTSEFNTIIKPKLFKIIENLPKITISDATDNRSSYYKLYSLLYWIKGWDNESLYLLEEQLIDNVYKGDHGKYILDTLKWASGTSSQ